MSEKEYSYVYTFRDGTSTMIIIILTRTSFHRRLQTSATSTLLNQKGYCISRTATPTRVNVEPMGRSENEKMDVPYSCVSESESLIVAADLTRVHLSTSPPPYTLGLSMPCGNVLREGHHVGLARRRPEFQLLDNSFHGHGSRKLLPHSQVRSSRYAYPDMHPKSVHNTDRWPTGNYRINAVDEQNNGAV